jgi:V/A-type H+/Na+-transporting ATPase subunit E
VSLESVVQSVQDRGRSEAAVILAEAAKEREEILTASRAEGAKILAEAEARGREVAERRRVQELARAELEARRFILSTQKEQLDEVYRRAQERLGRLPENAAIIRALLRANEPTWKDGGRVFAAPKDAELVKGIVGKAYAGPIEALGGVVIENADGSVRLDLRYESLLRGVWENAIREVAETLWPSRARKA